MPSHLVTSERLLLAGVLLVASFNALKVSTDLSVRVEYNPAAQVNVVMSAALSPADVFHGGPGSTYQLAILPDVNNTALKDLISLQDKFAGPMNLSASIVKTLGVSNVKNFDASFVKNFSANWADNRTSDQVRIVGGRIAQGAGQIYTLQHGESVYLTVRRNLVNESSPFAALIEVQVTYWPLPYVKLVGMESFGFEFLKEENPYVWLNGSQTHFTPVSSTSYNMSVGGLLVNPTNENITVSGVEFAIGNWTDSSGTFHNHVVGSICLSGNSDILALKSFIQEKCAISKIPSSFMSGELIFGLRTADGHEYFDIMNVTR